MHEETQISLWQGRVDAEEGGERWHQRVRLLDPRGERHAPPGLALLGVCSDAGVTRNLGRGGARNGPDAVRKALAPFAWHQERPLYDAGNLICVNDDLEGVQEEQARWVAALLELEHFPLLIGGGHEMALGTFLGLQSRLFAGKMRGEIGVINFDSHFDLRAAERSTSGTPFLQIARRQEEENLPFRYLCLGVSEPGNTAALFRRAGSLGAEWLLDEELAAWNMAAAERRVRHFLARCDFIHLSIDLDILPASVAPGVSAPAPRGVALEVVEHLLQVIGEDGGKVAVAEIAEMNPEFDGDGRTAKVAARLCYLVARSFVTSPGESVPDTEGEIP
ncbi:formimidoylglutamase [Geomonas sp. RF6]|uniref:formimidoylglutamase n=1 Tax=Geomonas sp. RF6 TaxID=2897342 RepID=UPI001E5F7A40|nr:formimidoylglutamase [Geomonas sp. RF6]UFS70172.1 formimidoylglutamase [Geomonas sp. RF6]